MGNMDPPLFLKQNHPDSIIKINSQTAQGIPGIINKKVFHWRYLFGIVRGLKLEAFHRLYNAVLVEL